MKTGPRPRPVEVLLEQLRVTGLALRRPALVGVAIVVLMPLLALPTVRQGGPVNINGWPTWLPGIIGALLPFAVWGRDDPFGSGFLWTLPVDRGRHALFKVAAGWLWLMAGVPLLLLWFLVLTRSTGGHLLPDTLHLAASRAAIVQPVDPATLRTVSWDPGTAIWLVPFAGATATYLIASALRLGTRHPLRWVIGVTLLCAFSSTVGEPINARLGVRWVDAPDRMLKLLVDGRYGIDALLTARNQSLSTTAVLMTGEPMRIWWGVPSMAEWRMATLLWTGLGLAMLWIAISRHGERRRG